MAGAAAATVALADSNPSAATIEPIVLIFSSLVYSGPYIARIMTGELGGSPFDPEERADADQRWIPAWGFQCASRDPGLSFRGVFGMAGVA